MHFNMRSIDWWLVIPMAILLTIGYIMVFSTTSFKGLSEFNDAYYFIKRHSLFLMLGIALFTCGSWLPVKYYKKCAFWGYLVSVALLLITLIPTIGVKVGGANRWLNFLVCSSSPLKLPSFGGPFLSVLYCQKRANGCIHLNMVWCLFLSLCYSLFYAYYYSRILGMQF